MAWHAVRAAGESVTATRTLLASASLAAWARLAVLVLFVGTLVTPFLIDFNQGPSLLGPAADPTASILLLAVFLGVLALCVGAVFEFVFLDVLRGERITLVSGSERRFHPGMELFALRVALALPVGATLVVFSSVGTPLALVLAILLAIVAVSFDRLTVAFVVPIMLIEACSLREGWRAFARTVRGAWREYVVYLFVAVTLWSAIAVTGGLLGGLLAVAFLVPFGTLGAVVEATLLSRGLSEATVGPTVFATLTVPYVVTFLAVVLLVHVPLVTYLRYIALFVLGDVDERHDPIPQLRAAIRRESGFGRRER